MFAGVAQAEKIVCGPYASTVVQPDNFKVIIDGGAVINSAPVAVSGGVRLQYDVTALTNGNHTSTLQACKGTRCSSTMSFPFSLTAPTVPAGVLLEP